MTRSLDLIGRTGMQFFGRTAASISHELKNALAIIKENAGLLNDYLLMADKGRPVDLVRFKTIAGRIESQTLRTDDLIKTLNRFAHSVDEPLKSVQLDELLGLTAALARREAAMHQVTLTCCPIERAAIVTTDPYLLLTLVGRCLTFALDGAGAEKSLQMSIVQHHNTIEIIFEPLQLTAAAAGIFPAQAEKALLDALGAECRTEANAGRLIVALPTAAPDAAAL